MENLKKKDENWQHDTEFYEVVLVHLDKISTSNVTRLCHLVCCQSQIALQKLIELCQAKFCGSEMGIRKVYLCSAVVPT